MLAQALGEPRVELDRDHPRRLPGERERQGALARADLEEHVGGTGRDHAQQLLDRGRAQEVLSEPAGHARSVA